jgi:hypothetical protein
MRAIGCVGAIVGFAPVNVVTAADAFGPAGTTPAAHSFTVRKLKLTSSRDAQFVVPNDAKTFGVGADPATICDVLRQAGAPTDRITVSVSCLLVRVGNRLLLIDAGLGPKSHGGLIGSLHEVGV